MILLYHVQFDVLGNQRSPSPLSGEIMIFGRPVLQCPGNSCLGRCNMVADKTALCSCDEHCRTLGDCCVDAHVHCFGARPDETHMLLPKENDSTLSHDLTPSMICTMSLYRNGTDEYILKDYRMVTSCPVGNDGDAKCSDVSTDLLHSSPVCLPQSYLIFRNIYCLRCHGFPQERAVAFELDVLGCYHWYDHMNKTSGNATILRSFWKDCGSKVVRNIPKACQTTASRMLCPIKEMPGNTCAAYRNPVTITDTDLVYKNQFCTGNTNQDLKCFAYEQELYETPFMGFGFSFTTFTVFLDFSHGHPVTTVKKFAEYGKDENGKHIVMSNGSSKYITFSQFMSISPIFDILFFGKLVCFTW